MSSVTEESELKLTPKQSLYDKWAESTRVDIWIAISTKDLFTTVSKCNMNIRWECVRIEFDVFESFFCRP